MSSIIWTHNEDNVIQVDVVCDGKEYDVLDKMIEEAELMPLAYEFMEGTGKRPLVNAIERDGDEYQMYASYEFLHWLKRRLFVCTAANECFQAERERLLAVIAMQNLTITNLTTPTSTGSYSGTTYGQ